MIASAGSWLMRYLSASAYVWLAQSCRALDGTVVNNPASGSPACRLPLRVASSSRFVQIDHRQVALDTPFPNG